MSKEIGDMVKVYTYADPFALKQAHFWEEIRQAPNLCVSQTLVNGLKAYHNRESFFFIDTIEKFLQTFYKIWHDDPENDIEQYVSLSKEIDEIEEEDVRKSFKFNQRELQKAMRYMIELELDPHNFESQGMTKEQKLFLYVYKRIRKQRAWKKLDKLRKSNSLAVAGALLQLMDQEIVMEEKELQKLKEIVRIPESSGHSQGKATKLISSKQKDYNVKYSLLELLKQTRQDLEANFPNRIDKVVIHGVHQFSPLLLQCIEHLEKLNIEVIFVIHYMENFPRVFQTWKTVYEWVQKPFQSDHGLSTAKKHDSFGSVLGDLIEGKRLDIRTESIPVRRFHNLTEFSDHVSRIYEKASGTLGRMNEHFYAPNNSEAHELLKMYHPDQFGDKHLLSYPIGQFILGLYNMWDAEKKRFKIHEPSLRECLAINIFNSSREISPLQTYNKISLFFKYVEDMTVFQKRLSKLISTVQEIEKKTHDPILKKLKGFSFYHCSSEELIYFQRVITDLVKITQRLFGSHQNGHVNYKEHFKKLLAIIQESYSKDVSKKEKEILDGIEKRLSQIEHLEIEGSIADLKEVIHFYLNRLQEENDAQWIVKNFEQLEGDLLVDRSKRKKSVQSRNIHIGLMTDQKMKVPVRDLLPWPLGESFFQAYNGYLRNLDIVLTSKREYSNFLRYALFNVALFAEKDIKISYIENTGEDMETPYFLLDMIGMKVEDEPLKNRGVNAGEERMLPTTATAVFKSVEECRALSICSYRYMQDFLLTKDYYFQNEYQCRLYYRIMLLERVMEESKTSRRTLEEIVEAENQKLQEYFPFWKAIDFYDIKKRLLRSDLQGEPDSIYVQFRLQFLYGRLTSDTKEENRNLLAPAWEHWHSFARYKQFDNLTTEELDVDPVICEYCTVRDICLHYYRFRGDSNE